MLQLSHGKFRERLLSYARKNNIQYVSLTLYPVYPEYSSTASSAPETRTAMGLAHSRMMAAFFWKASMWAARSATNVVSPFESRVRFAHISHLITSWLSHMAM